MSNKNLPDFEHTLAMAQGNVDAPELAECHGVCCGLLCRRSSVNLDGFMGLLDMLEMVKSPGTALKMSLEELLIASKLQLSDDDLGVKLWLPNDDETLEDRTMALSQWCSGFLAGIGSSGDDALDVLSEDSSEALRDFQQIAAADVTDTTESEEDENSYAEIVEYIRVAIMLMREDLRAPDEQDAIH